MLDVAAWNYPLLIAVNVIVPALLAGNAVLVKHARLTPLCGGHFADAFARTEVPAGLVAAVTLDHDATAALIRVRRVGLRLVHRLGRGRPRGLRGRSPTASSTRASSSAARTPPTSARTPTSTFAAENVVDGAFYNAGQSCCGIERVYVARPLYDRFVDARGGAGPPVPAGRPGGPGDHAGAARPAGRAPALVEQHVAEARAAGARVLTGGAPWRGRGYFCEPTVLTDVDHGMKVMWEETFGPVVGIMPVRDDAEAVRAHERQPLRAHRVGVDRRTWTARPASMSELDAGTVYANRCDYLDPLLPWVGVKDSGKGCSLSHLGFGHLTRPKSFHLRTRTRPS